MLNSFMFQEKSNPITNDNLILDNWLCLLLEVSDESSNFPDEARIGIIAALRNQIMLFSFVNDTSICHKTAGIYNYKLFILSQRFLEVIQKLIIK